MCKQTQQIQTLTNHENNMDTLDTHTQQHETSTSINKNNEHHRKTIYIYVYIYIYIYIYIERDIYWLKGSSAGEAPMCEDSLWP